MDQKISIRHKCHLESTTIRFRYAEIHERRCDSSRDLEVKASSGHPVAPCHLQIGFSVPGHHLWEYYIENNLRSALFILLTISCIDSSTQLDVVPACCHQTT